MNTNKIHAGQVAEIITGDRNIIAEIQMVDGDEILANGEFFSIHDVVDAWYR